MSREEKTGDRGDGVAEPEVTGAERPEPGLPKRIPAQVRRGPRPGPGLTGPKRAEPGPIAALRKMRDEAVPLERVRYALEELDERGEPSSHVDGVNDADGVDGVDDADGADDTDDVEQGE